MNLWQRVADPKAPHRRIGSAAARPKDSTDSRVEAEEVGYETGVATVGVPAFARSSSVMIPN